ncbi:hypothetical protein D5086_026548 [Populus alba]|uniref:Uncharacterized protein n=1 Tax=Populus alba TaxID=43335 RepID=A0ACC4B2N4_POPAL
MRPRMQDPGLQTPKSGKQRTFLFSYSACVKAGSEVVACCVGYDMAHFTLVCAAKSPISKICVHEALLYTHVYTPLPHVCFA